MEEPPPCQGAIDDQLAPTPACAALFPHLMPDGGSRSESSSDSDSRNKGKGKAKWGPSSFPPLPFPLLQAFERWLSGVPSPPELMELGSAPPPTEEE